MSILVRGLQGVHRSRNVHFCPANSRCQRNNVAGETSGPRSRSTFDPIVLASAGASGRDRDSAVSSDIRRSPHAVATDSRHALWASRKIGAPSRLA